jgi:FeS assembly SUF system protein
MEQLARAADSRLRDVQPNDSVQKHNIVSNAISQEALREPIIAALRRVYDPEIPVNVYDLGLIYRIDVADNGDVEIDMTLTSPSCPVAGMMPLMVKNAVGEVDGVGLIAVAMVWDPPWSQEHLSDDVRLELGVLYPTS